MFLTVIIIILSVFLLSLAADYILRKLAGKKKIFCDSVNIPYADSITIMSYRKYHKAFITVLVYAILVLFCLLALFPFFWMITSSLKTPMEVVAVTELKIFPAVPQWYNYVKVFETIDVWSGLKNTLIVEVCTIPPAIFFSALEAFAFSKMRLRHKNVFLMVLLSGLMIPYASVLLPQFQAYFSIGLVNTLWPLILPSFFGNISIMFFFIQYMRGIPNALFEAAKIDGAGHFVSFISIMLPVMLPALAVQSVFMFVANWNDFFAPSIYLSSDNMKTLQVMLQGFASNGTERSLLFAGAFITCIPLFIIYLIFQKYFVGALAISGIKG